MPRRLRRARAHRPSRPPLLPRPRRRARRRRRLRLSRTISKTFHGAIPLLLSMTGFGEAHRRENSVAAAVETRTINGRYFKLNFKSAEGYSVLEAEVESVVREQIKRGSVQVNLRVDRPRSADDYRVNLSVLENYRRQIAQLGAGSQPEAVPLATLLTLPGAVDEHPLGSFDPLADWPLVKQTLLESLDNLAAMRRREGE